MIWSLQLYHIAERSAECLDNCAGGFAKRQDSFGLQRLLRSPVGATERMQKKRVLPALEVRT